MDEGIFNLHYLNFYRKNNKDRVVDKEFYTYLYPDKITKEETYKLLSFLIDEVKENTSDDLEAIFKVNRILPCYGFFKLPFKGCYKSNELYYIDGDKDRFNSSKYSKKYIEWYTDHYTLEEIKYITDKLGKKKVLDSKRLKLTR